MLVRKIKMILTHRFKKNKNLKIHFKGKIRIKVNLLMKDLKFLRKIKIYLYKIKIKKYKVNNN